MVDVETDIVTMYIYLAVGIGYMYVHVHILPRKKCRYYFITDQALSITDFKRPISAYTSRKKRSFYGRIPVEGRLSGIDRE